ATKDVLEEVGKPAALAEHIAQVVFAGGAIFVPLAALRTLTEPLPVSSVRAFAGAFPRLRPLLVLFPVRSYFIVLLSLFGVGQDFVGFADFLEMLFGLFVIWVNVRMMLSRELPERRANIFLRGGLCNAKRCVVVLKFHIDRLPLNV